MVSTKDTDRNWRRIVKEAEVRQMRAGQLQTREQRRLWELRVPKNPTPAEALAWQIAEARITEVQALIALRMKRRVSREEARAGRRVHKRTQPVFTERQIEIAIAAEEAREAAGFRQPRIKY